MVRTAASTGLFLLALLAALHFGRDFLMPIALAITMSLMLRPIVSGLRRIYIPASLGAGIVILGLLGILVFATMTIYEPAMDWAARAPETMRRVGYKLTDLQRRMEDVGRAAAEVEKLTNIDKKDVTAVQVKGEPLPTTLALYTADLLSTSLVMVVMLYFLLATRGRFLHKALALLVQPGERASKVSLVSDTEQNVSSYLFTITAINLGLGIAVSGAMWAWGMPNPLLWGAMATVLNFVPYIGAVTGVVIVGVVGIVTFPDMRWAAVPLTYLFLTSLEGMLITPTILGRRFSLDPVVVFVWLIFWGWLWGIGGALLAMPLLVTLRIISERSPVLGVFGQLISSEEKTLSPRPAAVAR